FPSRPLASPQAAGRTGASKVARRSNFLIQGSRSGATNDRVVTICAPGSAGEQADMLTTNPYETDKLHEECGVFGVWGADSAAALAALGLHALQHRGQEAAGITSFDGKSFHSHRGMGHVADNFENEAVIRRLTGRAAIGHVRYATTGDGALRNVQPLFAELAL